MGYVTIYQLAEKYGSYELAAKAYLTDQMTDPDETEAVEHRLKQEVMVRAHLDIISDKIDEINNKLDRLSAERGKLCLDYQLSARHKPLNQTK